MLVYFAVSILRTFNEQLVTLFTDTDGSPRTSATTSRRR
jgi:hypothetical protein